MISLKFVVCNKITVKTLTNGFYSQCTNDSDLHFLINLNFPHFSPFETGAGKFDL